jgi:hypothetical protein
MGRTRFGGPVYGAKSILFSAIVDVAGSSGTFGRLTVPSGEDWYATEFGAGRESTGVSGHALVLSDDSTVLSSLAFADVNAGSTVAALSPDSGEDEGVRIAGGSVVTLRTTSTATGKVSAVIHGYRRFVSSTRAE